MTAEKGTLSPYYDDGQAVIYHANCLTVLPLAESPDLICTDPPYPNHAGHFLDGIGDAAAFMRTFDCPRWLVFWHQLDPPDIPLPLVARHVWHRTNTNRPDNYEAIYEYAVDGIERPSIVFPYAVIAEGLTGCAEATGHPTQKNVKLMRRLLALRPARLVLDPFMGSGTTLRAAKDLGIRAIGIEIDERWCEVAARRLGQGVMDFGDVVEVMRLSPIDGSGT